MRTTNLKAMHSSLYFYNKYVITSVLLLCLFGTVISTFDPSNSKTYLFTCTSNEDSNHPVQPRSLIRILTCDLRVTHDAKFLHGDSEYSDQTVRPY